MSGRSGWCPPGVPHESAHRVCEMRQNDPDERTRLGPCDCDMHGGHTPSTTTEDND